MGREGEKEIETRGEKEGSGGAEWYMVGERGREVGVYLSVC